MTIAADTLRPFQERREKNLAFFKRHYPGIYEHFWQYKMKKAKLNILPDTGEVDILIDGLEGAASLYRGRGKAYAREEVAEFEKAYRAGSQIVSVDPPYAGAYSFPRFFAQRADQLVKKSPITAGNFKHYWLEDFYPCIVFLGVGAGYHIEEFLNRHRVNSVLILEPNLDYFAASLYSVDWENICTGFNSAQGTTIHLLVGAQEDSYLQWAMVWNNLIRQAPAFPVTTLFYNHCGLKSHDELSDKICDDLYIFLMSWGNYDDELNQMNQAAHNFTRDVKLLPKPSPAIAEIPVFVIGAGPSLDDRLDQIEAFRDKALILSCGSAITSLHARGIKPDIHIELESDYQAVVGQYESLNDPDYLKSLRIIGPCHLNPLAFEAFGERRCYFKSESGLANMFGEFGEIIEGGTPTCTNLGLAFALHYGFEQIYLFGMDFGFASREQHHAAGSIYYENEVHQIFKQSVDYENQHVFYVDAYDGGKILTQPSYFTAKRKVEFLIKSLPAKRQIYNCSNGAAIEGAEWLSRDSFGPRQIAVAPGYKQKALNYLFAPDAAAVPVEKMEAARDRIATFLEECAADIESIIDCEIDNLDQMNRVCNRINGYFEEVVQRRVPEFYFFMRGTVRHFLYIGYSHAFGLRDQVLRMEFVEEWQRALKEFFRDVQVHYRTVMYKPFDLHKDPWVSKSITDPEEIGEVEELQRMSA